MCIEDVRLGRVQRGSIQSVAVTNGSVRQLVGPDPHRVSLTIYPPLADSVTVGQVNESGVLSGIVLGAAGHPIILDIRTHGELVTMPWFARSGAGNANVGVMTSSLYER